MSLTLVKILIAALAAGASALPNPSGASPSAPAAPSYTPIPPAPAVDFTKLLTQPTVVDRFKQLVTKDGKLLPADQLRSVVSFDFNGAQPAPGAKGGAIAVAGVKNFPILAGEGIAVAVGTLGPCGLNTPHTHPRGTEFLTVTEGEVDFGYILENGLVSPGENSEIAGHLSKFQGAVFPIGSIHYQQNTGCGNATFVAALTSEDPGTSQIAQNFLGLNGDVVAATVGFPEQIDGARIEEIRKNLPVNVALGVEQCLQRCGIQKK